MRKKKEMVKKEREIALKEIDVDECSLSLMEIENEKNIIMEVSRKKTKKSKRKNTIGKKADL